MSELGMDPAVVRELAAQLSQVAGQLAGVASHANTIVGHLASDWYGSEAERYAHEWQYQHRAQLASLSGLVQQLATTARTNADQQDAASTSLTASGGGFSAVTSLVGPAELTGTDGPTGVFWDAIRYGLDVTSEDRQLISDGLQGAGVVGLMGVLRTTGRIAPIFGNFPAFRIASDNDEFLRAVPLLGDVGKKLPWVGIGLDGTEVLNGYAHGQVPWGAMVNTGIDAVGMAVPEVAAAKLAWDLSTGTTKWFLTDTKAGKAFENNLSDAALGAGATQVGGDPTSDPHAAQALVNRYSGWRGPINATRDEFTGLFR